MSLHRSRACGHGARRLGVIEPLAETERSKDAGQRAGERRSNGDERRDSRTGDAGFPLTRVTPVIDGDTVHTSKLGRVRLIGVDTPEEGRCGDTAATSFTRRRLDGELVGYELGVDRKDRYRRTLAYLYRGKEMHNLALLEKGYAKVFTIPPNSKYASRFTLAERSARGRDVGAWGICERQRRAVRRAAIRRKRARARVRAKLRAEARARRARRNNSGGSGSSGGGGRGGGGGGDFNIPGIPFE